MTCEICGRIPKGRLRVGKCKSCYEALRLRGRPPLWHKGPPREIVMGPGGCHILTGKTTPGGYTGQHRPAWEAARGPIPDGYTVDHECHNEALRRGECEPGPCLHRRCVNPDHLRLLMWAGPEGHAAQRVRRTS